jgi:hypothetical protein
MHLHRFLAGAIVSAGSVSLGYGMGSGPHPHLLIAIPPAGTSPADNPVEAGFLFLAIAFVCLLVWCGRMKKKG